MTRSRLDSLIGDGVEAAVKAKHRRRLRRLGWDRRLEPRRRCGRRATRRRATGCELEVLIDGARRCPRWPARCAARKRYVHITGWHLAPHFELVRASTRERRSGALLAELAETGRRAGAGLGRARPCPPFTRPARRSPRRVENLVRGTRIRCETDPREHPFHCHHEKTIVIDGEVAFVGGIDLTDDAGDRFDSQAHDARRRLGWHDVATRCAGRRSRTSASTSRCAGAS